MTSGRAGRADHDAGYRAARELPDALHRRAGRLRCGAAVGPHQYERVEALIAAGADVLVVDTAHGHSKNVLDTVRAIKDKHDIQVIAGNVATARGRSTSPRRGRTR
jgi:IMP dehydrogenase